MAGLRIATRESRLALVQAALVRDALRIHHSEISITLVPMTTTGDQLKDRTLAAAGGKGLFLKELETALQCGDADLAVHSMKDVPVELPDGLEITAVLPRANAHDVLISEEGFTLAELPVNARVGTSSLRRQSQLRAARPDLNILPLRGNLDTRLKKLYSGDFDAIVLASAGIERLGIDCNATVIDPAICVPAVGQGAIGIECRTDDTPTRALVGLLNDVTTERCVNAERMVARVLEADCASPIASHCQEDGMHLDSVAIVATPDGKRIERVSGRGDNPETLGNELAEKLKSLGALDILNTLRVTHD